VQPAPSPPPGPPPIIVKLIEAPHDPTGLADVLLGALGLSGVIALIAVVCGVAVAVLLFWFRRRSA
jgi:hypothetical protein